MIRRYKVAKVEVYSSEHCPYCVMAKQLLDRNGITYTEIRIDLAPEKRKEMVNKSRQRTVPQIFINDRSIGGYTDLLAIENTQKLEMMLNSTT